MSLSRTAAALSVAALVLAACGDRTSPRERLAAAPDATTGEGTAAFAMSADMKIGEEGSGMDVTLGGEGAMDLAARTGHMEMTMPGMGASLNVVFDTSAVYLRIPSMPGGGQAQWIRQTDGTAGMRTGTGFGGDPSYLVDVLDAVEGEISELGADTVRGADVRGYGFTVSGEELWGERDDVPEAMSDLDVPVEAWLDGQNRLRRMVMRIDMGAASRAVKERMSDSAASDQEREMGAMMGAMTGTMTLTTEFYDFGRDVQVEVPDSTEVMDAEEFQRRMMERSGGR